MEADMGLFGPDRRAPLTSKYAISGEWPERYYREFDPAVRLRMLEECTEDTPENLEQMKQLFELRYKKDDKGKYADNFLRYFVDLRLVAEQLDKLFSKKRNIKYARKALENLQLHSGSQFAEDILMMEMYQLASFYIVACSSDINYTAVVFGLGKKDDDKIREKLKLDLTRIGKLIPKYLEMQEEFTVLARSIDEAVEEYL